MLILILSLVLVANIQSAYCKCIYENFNFEYPPIFTHQIESTEVILKPLRPQLEISESNYLNAYCDSNFSSPSFGNSDFESGIASISIKCSKGVLYYVDHENIQIDVQSKDKLACHGSQPEFYISHRNHCGEDGKSLAYGFTVKRMQIVLATFCYNFETKDPVRIHYSNSEITVLQNMQIDGEYLSPDGKAAMNFIGSNELRTKEMNSFFQERSEFLKNLTFFRFDYLVPIKRLTKSFTYQSDHLEVSNSIAWYINLKEGNWKLFEQLLEKEMLTNEYDIYTGVAYNSDIHSYNRNVNPNYWVEPGRIMNTGREGNSRYSVQTFGREQTQPLNRQSQQSHTYSGYYRDPTYNNAHNSWRNVRSIIDQSYFKGDIKYMSGSSVKKVPLFVWTYVKSINNDTESTVIFGINSPFVEINKYADLEFCAGLCPEWLSDLRGTANIPALGYVFCCSPEVARQRFNTLP